MKFENQCGAYIKHISDVLQRDCNNALQSTGLTLSQLTVLYQLEQAENAQLTLKELEKSLQVAQSTAAGIISRLEKKGLVEGFTNNEDKRIKMVRITAKGHDRFIKSQIHSTQSEAHLLSCLDENEAATLKALLKKVSENL